jgi:NADH:ubiquinone oxidoreductase subunit 6 (subunit J)
VEITYYDFYQWLTAYIFIIYSGIVFLLSLYIGLSKNIKYKKKEIRKKNSLKPILAYSVIIFFIGWSILMLYLKIGITISPTSYILPFKIIGILVYGRLIIQPVILLYIVRNVNYNNIWE